MFNNPGNDEITLKGIGASPGICIGKAYLVDKEGVKVVKKYFIDPARLESEKNRLKQAVKKAKDELNGIIADTPEEFREHANILQAHVVLLKDKMLYGRTLEVIERDGVNAEWALKSVVSHLINVFKNMSDDYFRERGTDIVHVSDRIMANLSGAEQVNIRDIDKRVILVARDLSPAETSQIQLERIKGFVTDVGGMASHTGIIARSLQIPAVLGLEKATALVKNENLLIVDGTAGVLIINPAEKTLIAYEERKSRYESHVAVMARGAEAPAISAEGITFQVMGNIELPEEVVSVKDLGGDGIGLYRSEFQYLSSAGFPSEFELFDKYRDVVELMAPRPVTIRTLDINGDKAVSYASDVEEVNPALGLRAIRYCLKKPEIFKTQLRAILRAAAHGNVRVLFPMISCQEELLAAKRMLTEAADSLDKEGASFNPDIRVGIMVEVPSVVIMADIMAKEVDFFSIGTNDLIQYSLAIDRQNRQVAHLFNPLHPAIIRMVRRVAEVARGEGLTLAMCGEMAATPLHIPLLLGLGIDELSMNPQSIPAVKRTIRSLSVAEAKTFVEEIQVLRSATEVRKRLEEGYGAFVSETFHIE